MNNTAPLVLSDEAHPGFLRNMDTRSPEDQLGHDMAEEQIRLSLRRGEPIPHAMLRFQNAKGAAFLAAVTNWIEVVHPAEVAKAREVAKAQADALAKRDAADLALRQNLAGLRAEEQVLCEDLARVEAVKASVPLNVVGDFAAQVDHRSKRVAALSLLNEQAAEITAKLDLVRPKIARAVKAGEVAAAKAEHDAQVVAAASMSAELGAALDQLEAQVAAGPVKPAGLALAAGRVGLPDAGTLANRLRLLGQFLARLG